MKWSPGQRGLRGKERRADSILNQTGFLIRWTPDEMRSFRIRRVLRWNHWCNDVGKTRRPPLELDQFWKSWLVIFRPPLAFFVSFGFFDFFLPFWALFVCLFVCENNLKIWPQPKLLKWSKAGEVWWRRCAVGEVHEQFKQIKTTDARKQNSKITKKGRLEGGSLSKKC